jgi:hypothetical protein
MAFTVFYSWQGDVPSCRNFIESSLKKAIQLTIADANLEEAIREDLAFDKDTMGAPGSPPIFDTILKKISAAAVFVPDLTFTGARVDGRPTPNPNVLIEYGWALKSLGYGQIIPVMNTAYGDASKLPFDLAHLRRPIQYSLAEQADDETRKNANATLASELARALRDILRSEEFRAKLPKPPAPAPFPEKQPLAGRARFRPPGEPLGVNTNTIATMLGRKPTETFLFDGPAMWLRVMPVAGNEQNWLTSTVQQSILKICVLPLISAGAGSIGLIRGKDGCGAYPVISGPSEADAVVWGFNSGEIWAINARFSRTEDLFVLDQGAFAQSLAQCVDFLKMQAVPPPYRWIAGMEGFEGKYLVRDNRYLKKGPCMQQVIEVEGVIQEGDDPSQCLRPFFERVFDSVGIVQPT